MGRAPIMVSVWKWKCRVILWSREWEAKQLEEYQSYIPVPPLEVNQQNMANSLSSPSLPSLLWLHTFLQHLWAWHRAPEKEGEMVERLQKSTEACSKYNRHKVLIQRDTWEYGGVRGQHVMDPTQLLQCGLHQLQPYILFLSLPLPCLGGSFPSAFLLTYCPWSVVSPLSIHGSLSCPGVVSCMSSCSGVVSPAFPPRSPLLVFITLS